MISILTIFVSWLKAEKRRSILLLVAFAAIVALLMEISIINFILSLALLFVLVKTVQDFVKEKSKLLEIARGNGTGVFS